LLALDFLLPIFLLSKSTLYLNKDYFLLSLFIIYIVFIFSVYSESFRSSFGFY
jgi:hypothetical protein